jgi:FkbM family methyltransferase
VKKFIAGIILGVAQNVGSPVLRFVRHLLPVPVKLALSRIVTEHVGIGENYIVAGNGLKFTPLKDTVFLHVLMEGFYEKAISDITAKLIRIGDVVVDVGANFGWYTLLMCEAVGKEGKVFSFEPNKRMFEVLSKNITLNSFESSSVAKQIGIGASKGIAQLNAIEGEYGLAHVLNDEDIAHADLKDIQEIHIETLDDLLAKDEGSIAYVKIDVEGFEPFVFLGGRKILESANPPILQVEFNAEALQQRGTNVANNFVNYLNKMDAHIFAGQSGNLVRKTTIDLSANHDLFIFPKKGKYSDRCPIKT